MYLTDVILTVFCPISPVRISWAFRWRSSGHTRIQSAHRHHATPMPAGCVLMLMDDVNALPNFCKTCRWTMYLGTSGCTSPATRRRGRGFNDHHGHLHPVRTFQSDRCNSTDRRGARDARGPLLVDNMLARPLASAACLPVRPLARLQRCKRRKKPPGPCGLHCDVPGIPPGSFQLSRCQLGLGRWARAPDRWIGQKPQSEGAGA